jgi:hypothetical protein
MGRLSANRYNCKCETPDVRVLWGFLELLEEDVVHLLLPQARMLCRAGWGRVSASKKDEATGPLAHLDLQGRHLTLHISFERCLESPLRHG